MNNEMERNEAEVATARAHPPAIANRKGNFRNCCAVQIHTQTLARSNIQLTCGDYLCSPLK